MVVGVDCGSVQVRNPFPGLFHEAVTVPVHTAGYGADVFTGFQTAQVPGEGEIGLAAESVIQPQVIQPVRAVVVEAGAAGDDTSGAVGFDEPTMSRTRAGIEGQMLNSPGTARVKALTVRWISRQLPAEAVRQAASFL